MNIVSWNVNGLRAWKEKEGTVDFLNSGNFDVICLQETKAQPEQISEDSSELFQDHPYQYFNSAEKKGYSSTAIFSKEKPLSVSHVIDGLELAESEGRVITAEYSDCYVVNVYTPNSKPDLSRVDYRYREWDTKFLKHLQKLEKKKPVIMCGDLNAAHQEIDIKNPSANKTTKTKPGNPGFTDKERERLGDYLEAGFVDTFRSLYPDTVRYSWWSYRFGARARNAGWRIDYVMISDSISSKLSTAIIHDDIHGSDHCPVSADIAL
jgi:exodeoxyribonuclease-3